MRHRKSFNHLGRTSSHRKAMLSNMASSLILHKRITTTVAKAKALRSYIEPIITRSKDDTTHSRRVVFSYLQNKDAVTELFREVAKKVADRPGGYTRIIKLENRQGDNAEMAMMELVDFNEVLLAEKTTTKTKTTRRRRGGKKKSAEAKNQSSVSEEVKSENTETVQEKEATPKVENEVKPAAETDASNKKEEVKTVENKSSQSESTADTTEEKNKEAEDKNEK